MQIRNPVQAAGLILMLVMALSVSAQPPLPPPLSPEVFARAAQAPIRVIVGLNVDWRPEHDDQPARTRRQREQINAARDALITQVTPYGARVLSGSETWSIPYVALEVNADALNALSRTRDLRSIVEDVPDTPLVSGGDFQVIDDVRSARDIGPKSGYDGTGVTIVVLDTGTRLDHPAYETRIVDEACFSYNDVAHGKTSLCPNGLERQTGSNAADPAKCRPFLGFCYHGTFVSGIAVGNSANVHGVASGASLIPIQVYSLAEGTGNCGDDPSPCVHVYDSDEIKALEYVYETLRFTHVIGAVNMSLGSGFYTDFCDSENDPNHDLVTIIDQLHQVNIPVIVATGNSGRTDGTMSPACISNAVAVSAVDDSHVMWDESDNGPQTDLLAPGVNIVSAFFGDGDDVTPQPLSGTSAAAPFVAGVFAILRQAKPTATIDEMLAALTLTGTPITDTRNGSNRVKPFIQISAAIQRLLNPKPCNTHAFIYLASVSSACAATTATETIAEVNTLSFDGRFVLFRGVSQTISDIPIPCSDCFQAYIHDLETGVTEVVSRTSAGAGDESGVGIQPFGMSDDGRYVLYESRSPNVLTSPDYHGCGIFGADLCWHVIQRDRWMNTTTVMTPGANVGRYSNDAAISGDGNIMTMRIHDSFANSDDIYILNRAAQSTHYASVLLGIDDTYENFSTLSWRLSHNGRYAAIKSPLRLLAQDPDDFTDGYILNLETGQLKFVELNDNGEDFSGYFTVADSGRYAAYDFGDWENGAFSYDAYIYDSQSQTRVKMHPYWNQPSPELYDLTSSFAITSQSLSANDHAVIFFGSALCGFGCSRTGIFLYDLQTGLTHLISRYADLTERGTASPLMATISGDGKHYAEGVYNEPLIASDTNSMLDIYVFDIASLIVDSGPLEPPVVKPGKPTLLMPLDGQTVTGVASPLLQWSANGLSENVASYTLSVSNAAGVKIFQQTVPPEVCSGGVCAFDFETMPIGGAFRLINGAYSWQVKATNAAGASKNSAAFTFKIDYPGKPQNLSPSSGVTVDGASPVLQWQTVAGAAEYRIKLTRLSNGTKITIGWLTSGAAGFACTETLCTLDLAQTAPPKNLKKGPYTWTVEVRNTAVSPSVSKSAKAAFKLQLP